MIDRFGGTELIARDVLFKTAKTPGHQKTRKLSSHVPHKIGEIDEGFHGEGCADHKTCCRSAMYGLRD